MLWVVGIPLFVAILLVSHRKHLFDQDSPRHKEIIHEFGSLYLQYEEKYYLFEVTVIFKKMLLTGALTVVAPGSTVQVIIALVVILINMLFVLKHEPFADPADDFLAFATSLQMVFTLLVAILLMTDTDSKYYDVVYTDIALVVVNSISLFALFFSIAAMHPKVRAKLNSIGRGRDAERKGKAAITTTKTTTKTTKEGSSKVVPISSGSSKGIKVRGSAATSASTSEGFSKKETSAQLKEEAENLRTWGKA
jgi:hypothetical protein